MKRYSNGFKESVLKKVFSREDQSIAAISRETGINLPTLYSWIQKAKVSPLTTSNSSHSFSPEEKLQLVFQSEQLTGEPLGQFLREKGIFTHQLQAWKKEMLEALSDKPKSKKKDPKDQKIAQLEKEIRLKDKTLAEASVLLLIKKKVELYLASESTFYRILREEKLLTHRLRSRKPVKREVPTAVATRANQLWSWDITYLK